MLWMLFGVLFSVLPTFCVVIYKVIVGINFSYIDCAPDILLVVLAVCCNFINLCVDKEKSIPHILRWLFCIFMGIIIFCCWGLYAIIYFFADPLYISKIENNMPLICNISLVIICFCLTIGIGIEIFTAIHTSKKITNQN